jgi:hypothetical protein
MREDTDYINIIELENGKILSVKPLDASRLFIDTSNIAYLNIQKNKDNNISKVSFEDDKWISLGDKLTVKIGLVDSVYEVKMIVVEKNQQNVILFSALPNKTSTFLLPLLNKTKNQLKYDTYFVNAYLTKDRKHLCLLYRFTGTKHYKEFEDSMLKEKLCIKHIDYDPYHVMYLFRIPDKFKEDVNFFIEGKYSKFSNTLKSLIFRFYGSSTETVIFQVIHKSPQLKAMIENDLHVKLDDDMELASKPILEQEIIKF